MGKGDNAIGARLQRLKFLSASYPGLARWDPYTLPRRQTMVFDVESRLADDPRGAERRLFEKVPFIQQGS